MGWSHGKIPRERLHPFFLRYAVRHDQDLMLSKRKGKTVAFGLCYMLRNKASTSYLLLDPLEFRS